MARTKIKSSDRLCSECGTVVGSAHRPQNARSFSVSPVITNEKFGGVVLNRYRCKDCLDG